MKQTKDKLKKNPDRKDFAGLGKKVALGLVAATLLMDGTALANPETNQIDHQVDGPVYGKYVQSDNVAGGTLDITETGIVGTDFAPSAAYGGYTDTGNTYDGVDWSEHNHEYSNSLLVYGGLWGDGYGGYTEHGSAEHNYAYVGEEAEVHGKLYGGYSESSDAYTNVLAVYGHTYDELYGGRTEHGNVDTNNIQIEYGGVVNADHVYGGYSAEGTVNENIVHVHGSINGKDGQSSGIYGGYSELGDVTENYMHVAMDSSIKNIDGIYGGATLHNNAINNHASVLADISDVSKIIGGISYDGQATSNIVEIAGTVKAPAGKTLEVVGGYSTEGDVTHNKANVNGNVTGKVIGGYTASGTSSNNSVHISGHGVVTGQVYGGQAHGDNTHVQENTVKVEGNVTGQVIGGEAVGDGSVLDNTVTVSGKVTGNVAGGKVGANGVATGNTVTVGKNGVVDGTAFGAMVEEGATAGEADAGNKVLVSGGTVTDAIGAVSAEKTYEDVNGVKHTVIGTGDLQYNEVVIESGKVENKAIGAISSSNNSATHLDNNSVTVKNGEVSVPVGAETDGAVSANLNHVDIEGGKVDKAYGAIAKSNGSLTNNSVTISQGDIHATPNPAPKTEVRNATGGWSFSDTITAIEGNSVTINGGAVTGQLAGGKYLGKGNTKVSNNKVTVNGGEFNQYDPAFSRDIAAAGAISTGSGKVSDNYVTVNSHDVNISGVAGAMSEKGELSKNHVNVQDGTVDRAYGAISDGAASAKGNYVEITGTTTKVTGAVGAIGSKEDGSDYVDNYVTVNTGKDAKVDEAVGAITYGYGDVSENHVTVSAGTVESAIGAVSFYEEDEEAALPNNVNVHNNTTNVLGGKVTYANGAEVRGTGTADDNHVNVTGGEVKYASGAVGYTEKAGELTNNAVTVDNANSNVTGEAVGAVSMSNKLMSENHVIVNEGKVESAIGAVSYSEDSNARAEENYVNINGGNTKKAEGAVVYGAATADSNHVNVAAGTVDTAVGAEGKNKGTLLKNYVNIAGGTTTEADGAKVHDEVTADSNYVNIHSGTVTTAIGAKGDGTGKLLNNAVNIIGNEDDKAVSVTDAFGAESIGTGDVKGNEVNVNTDVTVNHAVGANVAGEALVENNKVNVNAGTVKYAAGAVVNGTETAIHNKANVLGGDVDTVIGAVDHDKGTLVENEANIIVATNNGKVDRVFGAESDGTGTLKGNSANINADVTVIDAVGAKITGDATADGNIVNINHGTVENAIGAASAKVDGNTSLVRGSLTNNVANIGNLDPAVGSDPTVQNAMGAMSTSSENISGNKVFMNSGRIVGDRTVPREEEPGVLVGASYLGTDSSIVADNEVVIRGGTVENDTTVAGAASSGAGHVDRNKVTIDSLTVVSSDPANPADSLEEVAGAVVAGTADAEGNTVVINDQNGKIDSAVGAIGRSAHKSIFNKNGVQINGGTIGEAIGADTVAGDVLNSEVTVSGGTVTKSIFGGKSETGDVIGSNILLSGGTVKGSVFGGMSDKGAVRNNVITVRGNANLDGASLYGYDGKAEGGHSGNTLNIKGRIVYDSFNDIKAGDWDWSTWADRDNQTLKTIGNFDNINIDEAVWGNPAITVENLELNNTNVHVNHVFAPSISKRSAIYNGKGANIIEADKVTGTLDPNSKVDRVDFGVAFTAKDVPLNLNHISGVETSDIPFGQKIVINTQTSVIGESRAAATALVNQGSDFMVAALRSMSKAESLEGGVAGAKAFIGGFGNSSKYTTGSHVKVNGWSGIAGVGSTTESGFTWGVFVETGRGSYSTRNNAYGVELHGDGDADYTGGGVGIRQDYDDGLYFDAGFRAGKMNNKLKDALWGPNGGFYGYDVSSNYYGAHIGVGKVFQNGKNSTMEVYGRYAYTHNKGKDFTIAGDEFSFNAVNSHRTQLGVMWEDQVNSQFKVRYGLGYEYEFGGKAGSSVMGYDLTAPSLRGGSLLYQVGMNYQMSDNTSIDLGLTGYSGKRQGISGNLMFNISF